jgi:hypothetical protein
MPIRQPIIQFWEMSDAPEHVRAALPVGQIFDWIAVVPPALQNSGVLSLLTTGRARESLCRHDLQNGDCLLAAKSRSAFDPWSLMVAVSTSEATLSKSRTVTASGHGRGSASRS